jgi:hypothetical protein
MQNKQGAGGGGGMEKASPPVAMPAEPLLGEVDGDPAGVVLEHRVLAR